MDEIKDFCNWDTYTECRHPQWWDNAQQTIDSMNLSIPEVAQHVEFQFDKLKEGCKLCLFAEIARQLRLLSVRSQ